MAKIINASIDLTKIDKLKIQTVDKNGKPFKNGAKYLALSITINDQFDNYGNNVSLKISQTKDEREKGEPAIYIGNGKVVWDSGQQGAQQPGPPPNNWGGNDSPGDDLPF